MLEWIDRYRTIDQAGGVQSCQLVDAHCVGRGSEYVLDVDLVFIAAGFLGTQDYIAKDFELKLTERTNVATKPGQYKTSADRVFVAGDMHRGQSLVVWAIREGREVAKAVDQDLMGYSNLG